MVGSAFSKTLSKECRNVDFALLKLQYWITSVNILQISIISLAMLAWQLHSFFLHSQHNFWTYYHSEATFFKMVLLLRFDILIHPLISSDAATDFTGFESGLNNGPWLSWKQIMFSFLLETGSTSSVLPATGLSTTFKGSFSLLLRFHNSFVVKTSFFHHLFWNNSLSSKNSFFSWAQSIFHGSLKASPFKN